MKVLKYTLILISLIIIGTGCERGTIIREEIEYIDKPHESCVSEPAPIYLPGEMLYGRVSGLKNCLPFMASVELVFFDYEGTLGTDLLLQTFEDWGNIFVRKEIILIGAQTVEKGTFSMYIPAAGAYEASYSTLQDFDILEDVFEIDETYEQNEITFSLLDRSTGHAQGFFNSRFLLSSNNPSGINPDTVVFQDCYFEAWKK